MNAFRRFSPALVILALASMVPAAQKPGPLDQKIAAVTAELTPALIALRRDIHEHPELSLQETRTAALVAEGFRALGLEVRTGIGGNGTHGFGLRQTHCVFLFAILY